MRGTKLGPKWAVALLLMMVVIDTQPWQACGEKRGGNRELWQWEEVEEAMDWTEKGSECLTTKCMEFESACQSNEVCDLAFGIMFNAARPAAMQDALLMALDTWCGYQLALCAACNCTDQDPVLNIAFSGPSSVWEKVSAGCDTSAVASNATAPPTLYEFGEDNSTWNGPTFTPTPFPEPNPDDNRTWTSTHTSSTSLDNETDSSTWSPTRTPSISFELPENGIWNPTAAPSLAPSKFDSPENVTNNDPDSVALVSSILPTTCASAHCWQLMNDCAQDSICGELLATHFSGKTIDLGKGLQHSAMIYMLQTWPGYYLIQCSICSCSEEFWWDKLTDLWIEGAVPCGDALNGVTPIQGNDPYGGRPPKGPGNEPEDPDSVTETEDMAKQSSSESQVNGLVTLITIALLFIQY